MMCNNLGDFTFPTIFSESIHLSLLKSSGNITCTPVTVKVEWTELWGYEAPCAQTAFFIPSAVLRC